MLRLAAHNQFPLLSEKALPRVFKTLKTGDLT